MQGNVENIYHLNMQFRSNKDKYYCGNFLSKMLCIFYVSAILWQKYALYYFMYQMQVFLIE